MSRGLISGMLLCLLYLSGSNFFSSGADTLARVVYGFSGVSAVLGMVIVVASDIEGMLRRTEKTHVEPRR